MDPTQTSTSGLTLSEQITILIFLLMIIGSLVAIIYNLAVNKLQEHGKQIKRIASAITQIATKLNIKLEDYDW